MPRWGIPSPEPTLTNGPTGGLIVDLRIEGMVHRLRELHAHQQRIDADLAKLESLLQSICQLMLEYHKETHENITKLQSSLEQSTGQSLHEIAKVRENIWTDLWMGCKKSVQRIWRSLCKTLGS